MDDVIRRISERLASQPSRRGMIAGLGKVALGVGAAIVGQSLFGHVAEASALMNCCDGKACAAYACGTGTHLGYTWSCGHYFCHDCFSDTQKNARGHWQYMCTYSVMRPVHHKPRHHVVHHRQAPHPTHPVTRTTMYAAPHQEPYTGGGGKVL